MDWNKSYLEKYRSHSLPSNDTIPSKLCQKTERPALTQYVGTYYNPIYGQLVITAAKNHQLTLSIGPQHMIWYLTYCQKNILKAYWPNPSHMPIPMLDGEQSLITFTEKNQIIDTMTIAYLNDDGHGLFAKTT